MSNKVVKICRYKVSKNGKYIIVPVVTKEKAGVQPTYFDLILEIGGKFPVTQINADGVTATIVLSEKK